MARQSTRCASNRTGGELVASPLALAPQRTIAARMVPAITKPAITIRPEGVVRECTRMCQQAIARLAKSPRVTATTPFRCCAAGPAFRTRVGASLSGRARLARLAELQDCQRSKNALA